MMKINSFNNKRAILNFERKMNIYEVKLLKSIINLMKNNGFKSNYLIYNESSFENIFDEDIEDMKELLNYECFEEIDVRVNYNDFLNIIDKVQDNLFMLIDNNEYIRSHLYSIIYPKNSNNIILHIDEYIFEFLKTKYQ